nr:MAG TPA: hypothetical protein [Caudoviricetes sp.]
MTRQILAHLPHFLKYPMPFSSIYNLIFYLIH